jgi:hypothetical protein
MANNHTYTVTVTDANNAQVSQNITVALSQPGSWGSGSTQLNGFTSDFADEGTCCGMPEGMNATLRIIQDHIGLSFSSDGPMPPSGSGVPGQGQINSLTGAYAVYNNGTWAVYPAKSGLQIVSTATGLTWLNTGAAWVVA